MFETEEIYIKVLFDVYKDCNELINLKQRFNSLVKFRKRGQDNNLKLINLYCHSKYYLVYPKAKQFIDVFLAENDIQYNVLEEINTEISKIIHDLLKKGDKKNRFNSSIDKVRKNKKFNFWMNSGKVKLSTMYSFKGWEINTLFLILSSDLHSNDPSINDELIYTALTRCKSRLFILDTGNEKYSDFFGGEILKYHR
jgi:superfamily I DNA/RNA helicase